MPAAQIETVLVGRSRVSLRRRFKFVLGMLFAGLILIWVLSANDVTLGVSGDVIFGVTLILLLGLALGNGYLGGGLLISWAVVFAPVFAWFVIILSIIADPASTPFFIPIGKALLIGSIFAIIIGTIGFTIGYGGQSLLSN